MTGDGAGNNNATRTTVRIPAQVAPADDGMRIDRWFRTHYPDMPFGRLQRALRRGEVRVDGARVKAGTRLLTGQRVRIPPWRAGTDNSTGRMQGKGRGDDDGGNPANAAFIRQRILFHNAALIAIDKPPGLAVQGGSGVRRHLDGMLSHLRLSPDDDRPRLVHRLDRDTGGVMLLARDRPTAQSLTRAFRDGTVRKIYWALLCAVPQPDRGRITLALRKSGPRGEERMRVVAPGAPSETDAGTDAAVRPARTDYAVLCQRADGISLVALWPRTGRTHQLRAHMAAIGAPILGDGKYGGKAAFRADLAGGKSLHLHAMRILLPDGVPDAGRSIDAPLPESFAANLQRLWPDAAPASASTPIDPFEGDDYPEWSGPCP